MFEQENKYFDQGTVLVQKGEDGAWEINSFCAPVGSPGVTKHTPGYQE